MTIIGIHHQKSKAQILKIYSYYFQHCRYRKKLSISNIIPQPIILQEPLDFSLDTAAETFSYKGALLDARRICRNAGRVTPFCLAETQRSDFRRAPAKIYVTIGLLDSRLAPGSSFFLRITPRSFLLTLISSSIGRHTVLTSTRRNYSHCSTPHGNARRGEEGNEARNSTHGEK